MKSHLSLMICFVWVELSLGIVLETLIFFVLNTLRRVLSFTLPSSSLTFIYQDLNDFYFIGK